MTALQWIIKEAKILRKKSPKMEWKKAVAQASAIYASKHKGKSPVGKKHAKKIVRKKAAKKVGVIKRKVVRKKVAKKKKISEQGILKKIHIVKHDVERLDEAQHKHMMRGIGGFKQKLIKEYNWTNTDVINLERELGNNQQALRENPNAPKHLKDETRKYINAIKSLLKEEKEHLKQIKKLL